MQQAPLLHAPTADTNLAMMQATQAQAAPHKALSPKTLEKIDGAAKDFEAMFVSEMVKPMFEGISTDGPFSGGKGEEVFRGLLVQEYGKIISQAGGLGMSSQIKDHMIKMQEQATHVAP